MVIDASVVLRAFFPDEEGQAEAQGLIRAHILKQIDLTAPSLLPYEVANALLQAIRRARIDSAMAQEILSTFADLAISTQEPSLSLTLDLAQDHGRSFYDAAYLALAHELNVALITGDRRLFNAVHQQLPWVLWIGDYRPSDED